MKTSGPKPALQILKEVGQKSRSCCGNRFVRIVGRCSVARARIPPGRLVWIPS